MRIHFKKGPVDWHVPTVNPEAPEIIPRSHSQLSSFPPQIGEFNNATMGRF
jgi:hypothetical protein